MKTLLLKTDRTSVYVQNVDLTKHIYNYYRENQSHLAQWEPLRNEGYYSEDEIEIRLNDMFKSYQDGNSLQLAALDLNEKEIVGVCNFTNMVRGPFQACFLGYSIAGKSQGKGLMCEILKPSIAYIFENFLLHRIMANYIPKNIRSGKLLETLGFKREGLAKSYLKIAGKWEDHILTSLINNEIS